MFEALAMLVGLRAVEAMSEGARGKSVPEPEFRPFRLPRREGRAQEERAGALERARVGEVEAANTARQPRTLRELGVPGTLAADFEAALRLMGAVDGDRIVGFTFRTADGATHPLRAEHPVRRDADRAA